MCVCESGSFPFSVLDGKINWVGLGCKSKTFQLQLVLSPDETLAGARQGRGEQGLPNQRANLALVFMGQWSHWLTDCCTIQPIPCCRWIRMPWHDTNGEITWQ